MLLSFRALEIAASGVAEMHQTSRTRTITRNRSKFEVVADFEHIEHPIVSASALAALALLHTVQ